MRAVPSSWRLTPTPTRRPRRILTSLPPRCAVVSVTPAFTPRRRTSHTRAGIASRGMRESL